MKKTLKTGITSLLLLGSSLMANAQINWAAYSQSANNGVMDKPSGFGLIVAIRNDNNSFWPANESSRYFSQLSNDQAFVKSHAANIVARTTFDTAKVHFFMRGINQQNAAAYEYRVAEYPGRSNDGWKPVVRFTDARLGAQSGMPQMAYLEGHRTKLGQMVIIDVRMIATRQIVATAMVAWESVKPVVSNIYTSDNFDAFLKKLQYPWAGQAPDNHMTASEDLSLSPANTNLIFFLKADIYRRDQIQYELVRDGKVVTPWKNNDYDNSFVWIRENRPGKYQVNIRYTIQPQHITSYRFSVAPLWYQTGWFSIAAGLLVAALAGVLIFVSLLRRQRRLTQKEVVNKTKLQLELKAIHAQLNPHFVFNALSSIQGLINKQDFKGANDYLADFAKLMRESLQNGDKDEIPLQKEIDVLNTYLRLEQLRFGFAYRFILDDHIHTFEISIPSLLLQPLIENAIKHGVSTLAGNGEIEICFGRKDDIFVVTLSDNGKGFTISDATGGYGLKLTRERIALLNQLKPGQQIGMSIVSKTSGTQITLTFNNWFL